MFVVTLDDGRILVEGRDVATWDDVPNDVKIASVKLTAGGSLSKTLTGFERYYCFYEGQVIVSQTTNETDPNKASARQQITAQVLYGVKNYNTWKNKVQQLAELEKKTIRKVCGTDKMPAQKQMLLDHLKKSTKKVLKHLNDREVTVVELRFGDKQMSQDKIDQNPRGVRKGVRDSSLQPDIEWILNALRSK